MKTEEKIEDIKVGETYYVRVKVKTKGEDYIRVTLILQGGVLSTYWPTSFALGESSAFSPIIPENSVKNSDPAPKYDPCRLFRDGDKVTPRLVNGRDFNSIAEEYRGKILTVTRDEEKYDNVYVEYGGDEFTIDPAYLELVTPAPSV